MGMGNAVEADAVAGPGGAGPSEDERLFLMNHPDGIVGPAVPADAATAMDMMEEAEFTEFVSVGLLMPPSDTSQIQ